MKRTLSSALPARLFLTTASPPFVYLTFDDGPDPEHTPRLLDTLAHHQVRATFFVVGRQVARYPRLVQRILRDGHTLGTHSYSHSAPAVTSALQLASEVVLCRSLLVSLTETRPKLFRPPMGKLTAAKTLSLWALSQTIVLWSVDPRDYARSSTHELRGQFSARPPTPGDIVLLHDNAPATIALLPELLTNWKERGLRFAPLPRHPLL